MITSDELNETLAHAPAWWNKIPDARHDLYTTILPMTATETIDHLGEIKKEYEFLGHHGRFIFWSVPLATFSRTRWSKIPSDKAIYRAITVRNANTAMKLAELAGERSK